MHAAAAPAAAIPAEAEEFSAQKEQLEQLLLDAEVPSTTELEEEDSLGVEEQHADSSDESSVDDEQLKATLLLADKFVAKKEQCQDSLFEAEESSIDEEHFKELLLEAEGSASDEEQAKASVAEQHFKDSWDEAEDEEPALEEEHGEDSNINDDNDHDEADGSSVEAEHFMHFLAEAEDSFAEQASPLLEAEESSGEEHCDDLLLEAIEGKEEAEGEEDDDDDELFKVFWAAVEASKEKKKDTVAEKAGAMARAGGIAAPVQVGREESNGLRTDTGGLGGLKAEDVKAQATPQSWRCKRLSGDAAGASDFDEVALPSSRVAAAPGRALASAGPSGPRLEEVEEAPHLSKRRRCLNPPDSSGTL